MVNKHNLFANHRILVAALAAYVNQWRVGANDNITDDIYWNALTSWTIIFDQWQDRCNVIVTELVIPTRKHFKTGNRSQRPENC